MRLGSSEALAPINGVDPAGVQSRAFSDVDVQSRHKLSGMNTLDFGALERTRTSDPQLRKLMLYPLSYERVRRRIVPQPT